MTVVYEDNHLIIVDKRPSEIVQGDKTGDEPLSETVKRYLKEKYAKPGNVFLGVTHRLDRPVSGLVVFAKTGKALARLNDMFRQIAYFKSPDETLLMRLRGWMELFCQKNEDKMRSLLVYYDMDPVHGY